MKKRILFILLAALLILALIFVLWFWFFGRHDKTDVLPGGSLGSGQTVDNTGASGGNTGNGEAPIGSNAGSNTNGGTSGSGSGAYTPTYTYLSATTTGYSYTNPSGVTWFDGGYSYTPGSSGSGGNNPNQYGFTQTPINGFSGSTVSGSPYITTVAGADGLPVSLISSLAVLVGGCLVEYGLIVLTSTAVTAPTSILGFPVSDIAGHGFQASETITECLARTLGHLAVQAITDSTVAWINSGFDGQPAYVQDFGQFFTDVADKSAGNFIEGTGLAFLCSPFQLQVKIAIAQAYANSKSSTASSCTLSGVTGNIDNFLNGSFDEGGWPAFLQFTTVPANNPYAGFIEGQIAFNNQILYDTANAKDSISPGGFLAQKKCPLDLMTGKEMTTGCTIVTPGGAVDDIVHSTFQGQLDSLQLGDSLDQIIAALTNQLISKVLYGGLFGAGDATDNSTPNAATTEAQDLMNTLQAGVTAGQQYAGIEQRSILDIQSSQSSLTTLANCWAKATSTSGATADQISQGEAGFTSATGQIAQLQTQVNSLNSQITAANSSITQLQSLQTDLLLATTQADVTTAHTYYNSLVAAGTPHIYTSTDVTAATQDRTTLQGQLSTLNTATQASLTQCYAL
jgi:hypothetical protein